MARELGFSPRNLIKNIPSKSEPWKAPVEDWVRNLYEKRRAKTTRPRTVQSPASDAPAVHTPPADTEPEPPPMPLSQDAAGPESFPAFPETELEQAEERLLARFDAGELDCDRLDFEMRELHRTAPVTETEVAEENRLMLARQQNFRRAAEEVARALAQHPPVQKVALFGSVALPLRKEVPRFARLRRARIAIWHECGDVDLAVWLSDLNGLDQLRRLIARTVHKLPVGFGGAVPHHAVDVHILEPGTNRYRGRLCIYAQCPKGKPNCYVPGCGVLPFLRQFRNYEFDPLSVAPDRAVTLFSREPPKSETGPPSEEIPF